MNKYALTKSTQDLVFICLATVTHTYIVYMQKVLSVPGKISYHPKHIFYHPQDDRMLLGRIQAK